LHTGLEIRIIYEKKKIRAKVTNPSFLLRRSQDLLGPLLFYFYPIKNLSDQRSVKCVRYKVNDSHRSHVLQLCTYKKYLIQNAYACVQLICVSDFVCLTPMAKYVSPSNRNIKQIFHGCSIVTLHYTKLPQKSCIFIIN
jgi:hypothetical protein